MNPLARVSKLLLYFALSAALAVGVWAGLGFQVLPWLVKRELPRLVEEKLPVRLKLGEVKFNPFTLQLRVTDVAVADRAGAPLVSLAAVDAGLSWQSLARRAWIVDRLRLAALSIDAVLQEDGRLNLLALVPPSDDQPPSPLPRFILTEFALSGGRLAFEDRRVGFREEVSPIDFSLRDLTTLSDARAQGRFSARAASGATLAWEGNLGLAPQASKGVVSLSALALPSLAPYLKGLVDLRIAAGIADVRLPYEWAQVEGRTRVDVKGAELRVGHIALAASEKAGPFAGVAPSAGLETIKVSGIDVDLAARRVGVQAMAISGIDLVARRDADGQWDWIRLLAPKERAKPLAANPSPAATQGAASKSGADQAAPTAEPAAPTVGSSSGSPPAPGPWQVEVVSIDWDKTHVAITDATAKVPVTLDAQAFAARARLSVTAGDGAFRVQAALPSVSLGELGLFPATSGALKDARTSATASAPFRMGGLVVSDLRLDTQAKIVEIGAVEIARLSLDAALRDGRLTLQDLVPGSAMKAPEAKPDATPSGQGAATDGYAISLQSLRLADGAIGFRDEANQLDVALEKLAVRVTGLDAAMFSPGAKRVLNFEASAGVRSGGRVTAKGQAAPGAGTVDATVELAALNFAPLRALVASKAGVQLASGEASLGGRVLFAAGDASLRYQGWASLANVALADSAGVRLFGWKSMSTESLRLSLAPNRLEIDELRLLAPAGTLEIARDGTTNLSRAFKSAQSTSAPVAAGAGANTDPSASATTNTKPAASAPTAAASPSQLPLEVSIRRVRVDDGVLAFSDDNIGQGFRTRIHELAGTANGLSSDRDTRSQFSFEGRVDEFGFARLSGALNAFAPRERTTFRVEMRNVDITRATPYAMRFAGYRIASGRLGLDVTYRVRDGALEGDNNLTLEQFELGERVDSPDALKLPLQLAIALLKDSDGRIVLDLPVTGSLDDPKFSIWPIVWRAVGNLIAGIVTAPFRALGRLFGGGASEELGVVRFDAGTSRLLPPEQEKILKVAEGLGKRPELKLSIPARYDAQADARVLRRAALARDIGRRAGFPIPDEESPGPLNTDDKPTREALRALFIERFSSAELDKLKAELEAKAATPAAGGVAAARPSLLERARRLSAGEPQLTEPREFYQAMLGRLRESQPLADSALVDLARRRADSVAGALRAAGVAESRLSIAQDKPADKTGSEAEARQIEMPLGLVSK